jgi:hypothetical protein
MLDSVAMLDAVRLVFLHSSQIAPTDFKPHSIHVAVQRASAGHLYVGDTWARDPGQPRRLQREASQIVFSNVPNPKATQEVLARYHGALR